MVSGSRNHRTRRGHTLMELVVATIASSALLAGLASVMFIARHIAYTPTAAERRTQAADVLNRLADEARYATLVLQRTSRILEFVVADRYADGAAENIRYEWSGTPGDPLYRTLNGTQAPVLPSVQDCTFAFDTAVSATSPVLRTHLVRIQARLQTGAASHSRFDTAIPLVARPERLSSYWRTDFDSNPTTVDANGDGSSDWAASNGGTFTANPGAGQLTAGTWHANGDLATNPANDFTTTTVVELQCKNMAAAAANADVLRINADRQGGTYAPLILRFQKQSDGSQMLTLLGKPTSATDQTLKTVDNLVDDYTRIRLTIQPDTNRVSLQINDVGDDVLGGPFVYPTHAPTSTDRSVKIGGGAKFDYVEVRVLAGS